MRRAAARGWPRASKLHPCGELEESRIAGRVDAAEGRGAEAAVGLAERRRVGDVEDLGAQLGAKMLGDAEELSQREVGILISGAAHGIARGAAQRKLRRWREVGGVEVARRGALRGGQIGIAE